MVAKRCSIPVAIILSFVLQHLAVSWVCSMPAPPQPLAPALYVFGDSLFDNGNNNYLPTFARANFLPYGVNFVKGVTGRFTNGRTVPDFIADFLRLPYPPPYMSIRGMLPVTGLNYASGSCGILSETGSLLGKCLKLDDQIDLFQRTVKSVIPMHFNSRNELLGNLSKSMFVFSIGNNDYINNYLQTVFQTSKVYTPQAFAEHLLDQLSKRFERLYNLGARRILMFEIGPIGCIPSIAKKDSQNGKCDQKTNQLISYFNDKLPDMLQNLTSTLPGSVFVHGHTNWLAYDAIMNPSKYGLMDTGNPCCTTWMNGTSACIPWLTACLNPDKHYFFDAFHLTEGLLSVIAARCVNDTSVCAPPLNKLVEM